jgi:hypothetical protein
LEARLEAQRQATAVLIDSRIAGLDSRIGDLRSSLQEEIRAGLQVLTSTLGRADLAAAAPARIRVPPLSPPAGPAPAGESLRPDCRVFPWITPELADKIYADQLDPLGLVRLADPSWSPRW